jgi:hypothetical protein
MTRPAVAPTEPAVMVGYAALASEEGKSAILGQAHWARA